MKFKRIIIFPYSMGSDGAKRVAAELTTMEIPVLRVFSDGKYTPKDGDYILGWGCGHTPEWLSDVKKADCKFFNTPEQVCRSIEKITAFRRFKDNDVPTPPWTQDHAKAMKWAADGIWVCCRCSTEGMDGRGLVLAKKTTEVVYAPLYTAYVPNEREFRVYVYDDEVLDVLEKRPDDEATDQFIRTESNHYIYLRQGANVPGIQKAARDAAKALGLTFAGVDVILGNDGKPYVLETNTAPGIGKITANRIALAIRKSASL